MLEELSVKQRGIFAEKTMDWGNLVFIGLVIGQLVPGTSLFRLALFILGELHTGRCLFWQSQGGAQPTRRDQATNIGPKASAESVARRSIIILTRKTSP